MEHFVDFRHIEKSWSVSKAPLIKAQYINALKTTGNIAYPLFKTHHLAMLGNLTINISTAFTGMLEYIDGMYKPHFMGDLLYGFIFEDKVPEFIQIHMNCNLVVTVKTFGRRIVALDTYIPFPVYPRLRFSFGTRTYKCYYISIVLTSNLQNIIMHVSRNYLWDSIRIHHNACAIEFSVSHTMRPLKNIVQDLARDLGIEAGSLLMRRSNRDAKALAGPNDIVFEPETDILKISYNHK